ncbi:MAG: hypothetical protein OXQ31_09740 [Spirochaetaceae bacterium]|nr:hypothetical protein [Spirochaetaceae bacterium]
MRYGMRLAALFAALALTAPNAGAEEWDVTLSGFLKLDHYGLVAEERLYTNERVRLTAAAQVEAANAMGDLSAFAELHAFAQVGEHIAVPETAVERRFGEVVVIDPEFIVRQAYVTLRTDAFDIDVGQKFVHWGKVDLLSPLDVINHTNTATLGLGDAFESPLADPMVHVTAYLDDALSLELVYVPFLAPDLIGIAELDFDLTFFNYDIDARFENPRVPLFSEWAHSAHAALSYTSFAVDAQVTYSFFRDQTPDFDLSGITETSRTVDGETHYVVRGVVVPGYNRAHNFGVGASAALAGFVLSADAGLKLTENTDGTRIDVKRPEILYAVQADRAVSIDQQPFNVSAGLYHRLILHPDAELKSEYSPLVENVVAELRDFYMLQEDPSTLYVVARADTSLFRETLSVGVIGAWGITERALHLAPRAGLRLSDHVSAAAGANLWFEWSPGVASGLLGRDDAKDNVFAQLVVRY